MDRSATKEAAEALLRELPSVVGAYVLEDIYGHPREIHVLISAGPSARHFARDVRDLLEEGLGVPIDQRVISIAQLAGPPVDPDFLVPGDAPAADAPAADAPPAASDDPASDRGAPDEAAPDDAASEHAASEPAPARRPRALAADAGRLMLVGTVLERSDDRVTVRVRLRHEGVIFEGEDTQIDTPQARLRAGARALLGAATHASRGGGRFSLEDVAQVRAIGRDYVLLTVLVQAARLGRRPLGLAGAHPLDEEIEVTSALAALKAINRVFARLGDPAAR